MARQAGSRLRAASESCVGRGVHRHCFLPVPNPVVSMLYLFFFRNNGYLLKIVCGGRVRIQFFEATSWIGAARFVSQRARLSAKPSMVMFGHCGVGDGQSIECVRHAPKVGSEPRWPSSSARAASFQDWPCRARSFAPSSQRPLPWPFRNQAGRVPSRGCFLACGRRGSAEKPMANRSL